MDVKSLLRDSRLRHYVNKCIGDRLISDARVKSLKRPLLDAVHTAVLHAFPSQNVKLTITEAQTMAELYFCLLYTSDAADEVQLV